MAENDPPAETFLLKAEKFTTSHSGWKFQWRPFLLIDRAASLGQTLGEIEHIMKTFFLPSLVLLFLAASLRLSPASETNTAPVSASVARGSRCFELRTYYAAPGKLEALNARFRDHTCALFKKHGMEIVGFWIPTDQDQGAENKLVYMLVHQSREAAKQSWKDFGDDPEWQKARTESEVNGKLTEKVESVFLSATDYSPLK
jgi:NIPSNAP